MWMPSSAGAETAAEEGIHVFSDEEAADVLEKIPDDSAAALILLEHHWAVPLRDAILRAGGIGLGDMFIHPEDLVAIGIATAAEAEELAAMHPTEGLLDPHARRISTVEERRWTRDDGSQSGKADVEADRPAPLVGDS